VGTTETYTTTDTQLKRIAWLSARDPLKQFNCLMHHFNEESLAACFHALDGRKAVGMDGISKVQCIPYPRRGSAMHFSNPCSRAKGFVLSPLPELGTMGSKWGGARVTDSSTSSRIWGW
jgi:hypothetical protein